jgi:hypothetical protein
MHYLRDLIYRLRAGDSERRIAADLDLSRVTVHKYHGLAQSAGYLQAEAALPDDAVLQVVLGATPPPPRQSSTLEPYRETVQQLLAQGCEMTAVFARLRDNYGYNGSYSAVRRFVQRLCPAEPRDRTPTQRPRRESPGGPFGCAQGRPLAEWANSTTHAKNAHGQPTSLWPRSATAATSTLNWSLTRRPLPGSGCIIAP